MKLKLIKNPNSNSIEATFYEEVETVTSIFVEKEIEGELVRVKEDKNIITANVIHCQSYSDLQIDLLKQFAKEFNTSFSKEQELIIKDVIANIVVPTKEELEAIALENEKQRVLSIKQEAGRIIESKFSIYWQLNHPRSNEQFINEYLWIDKIRQISNKAEEDGLEYNQIEWFK